MALDIPDGISDAMTILDRAAHKLSSPERASALTIIMLLTALIKRTPEALLAICLKDAQEALMAKPQDRGH